MRPIAILKSVLVLLGVCATTLSDGATTGATEKVDLPDYGREFAGMPYVWKDGVLDRGRKYELERNEIGAVPKGNGGPLAGYTLLATSKDTDGDGLPDNDEDRDLDGRFEPAGADRIKGTADDETNFNDADTDDDGLSDGTESGLTSLKRYPFYGSPGTASDPNNPDTDGDGLPDGLEMGLRSPKDGLPLGIIYKSPPRLGDTDLSATFVFRGKKRKCFIPDQDPESITDTREKDTNYDGISDGDSDLNCNGRADAGEVDAAAGWMGETDWGTPDFNDPIWVEAPRMVNGNPELYGNDNPDETELYYQSSLLDPLLTRDRIRISEPDSLIVTGIKPLFKGRRIFQINLKCRAEAKQIVKVWVESPVFRGGQDFTDSFKGRNPPARQTAPSQSSGLSAVEGALDKQERPHAQHPSFRPVVAFRLGSSPTSPPASAPPTPAHTQHPSSSRTSPSPPGSCCTSCRS